MKKLRNPDYVAAKPEQAGPNIERLVLGVWLVH
jgi:hypothetical protein